MKSDPRQDADFMQQLLDESDVDTSAALQTALLQLRRTGTEPVPGPSPVLASFTSPTVVPLKRRKAVKGAAIGIAVAVAAGLGASGVAAASPEFRSAAGSVVQQVATFLAPAEDDAAGTGPSRIGEARTSETPLDPAGPTPHEDPGNAAGDKAAGETGRSARENGAGTPQPGGTGAADPAVPASGAAPGPDPAGPPGPAGGQGHVPAAPIAPGSPIAPGNPVAPGNAGAAGGPGQGLPHGLPAPGSSGQGVPDQGSPGQGAPAVLPRSVPPAGTAGPPSQPQPVQPQPVQAQIPDQEFPGPGTSHSPQEQPPRT